MVFNTTSVGTAVTPTVIQTFFDHYLNRSERAKKPTAHISYDEGINLIKKFLIYASHHTVEELQRFTSQWVPHPTWVKVDEVRIDEKFIKSAADNIQVQLGPEGVERVGGKNWWQWRRPGSALKADWIEMRADYNERNKSGDTGRRVILYVHGGAYFFGSVDEHRYQLQRHARKLKARVFARKYLKRSRYRLSPQFPFPCGLHDCLAAYLHLLSVQDPNTIILGGDSAGGGMVLSMLVILRDQGIPLPAGAILISPWVDLTHSFPSVAGDNPLDYIPAYGFHHRPSPAWPPPNSDDMAALKMASTSKSQAKEDLIKAGEKDAVPGFHVDEAPTAGMKNENAMTGSTVHNGEASVANTVPGSTSRNLSIMIDGELVEIKDQIQMYTTNDLISHPLVSPILQPTLGGLPPLLILTGGGEALRDEQIYLAHKAAHPEKYLPGDAFLDEYGRSQINRWKPTDVQLQVWEDLCHVAPTLSFTRPAKYMYRSVAQFGAWALARAQKTSIEILDDDDVSVISSSSENPSERSKLPDTSSTPKFQPTQIGKAGDPLPPFKNHMIRQRVDRHGAVFDLDPASDLPSCNMDRSEIGVIKEGPVKKWMVAKKRWDTKYSAAKRTVQKQRMKEMEKGYESFGDGEVPPPSALAGRLKAGTVEKEQKKVRSLGMMFWTRLGSKHDKDTMDREEQVDKLPETTTATQADGAGARALHDNEKPANDPRSTYSRSRSRRRTVTDQQQTGENVDENTSAAKLFALQAVKNEGSGNNLSSETDSRDHLSPNCVSSRDGEAASKVPIEDRLETDARRPKLDGIAFPFSLLKDKNLSMTTLTSEVGVEPAKDLKLKVAGATSSGLSSMESIQNTSEDAMETGNGKGVAGREEVQGSDEKNGEERPGMETFVTAMEIPQVVIDDGSRAALARDESC